MKSAPLACVLGDMDLVRPLGLAGIRCAVVARDGEPTRYSRFTAAAIDWLDAWTEPERLVERLVDFARGQAEKPVLFYEEDRHLLLLSRSRERLAEYFRFVVAEAELVEDLVDKERFRVLAERLALPVPPCRRIRPAEQAPDVVDLPFPVILKPLTRRSEVWEPLSRGAKALRVDSPAALRELWPRLAEAGLDLLAQQLIPGGEERIESYHVYVNDSGETAGEFTGRKVRTYPAEYGISTALEITRQDDVLVLGRALVRRMGLTGVAKLDFKRAPDGRLYLLEVNPRFNLWHHPGAVAGVNLPALVYADLTGGARPRAMSVRAGVRWSYPWHDWSAARRQGISAHQWLAWTLGARAKSAVALDDPLPFLRGVLLRKLLKRRPAQPAAGTRRPLHV
jgi:predicted ATP-grasp superfamily ATP-dependent carboligase